MKMPMNFLADAAMPSETIFDRLSEMAGEMADGFIPIIVFAVIVFVLVALAAIIAIVIALATKGKDRKKGE